MSYLSKPGFKNNFLILKSLLFSKYPQLNNYVFPNPNNLKITFPIFDSVDLNKSKLIMIMFNFLEELSNCKPIITHAKILIKKGVFYKCQVNLSKSLFFNFLFFLNEFILLNNFLKFASKQVKLIKFNESVLSLILSDIDIFFDAYTRRFLPSNKLFWLELDFFFNKNFKIIENTNLIVYSQLFFCHNIFEWYLKN